MPRFCTDGWPQAAWTRPTYEGKADYRAFLASTGADRSGRRGFLFFFIVTLRMSKKDGVQGGCGAGPLPRGAGVPAMVQGPSWAGGVGVLCVYACEI